MGSLQTFELAGGDLVALHELATVEAGVIHTLADAGRTSVVLGRQGVWAAILVGVDGGCEVLRSGGSARTEGRINGLPADAARVAVSGCGAHAEASSSGHFALVQPHGLDCALRATWYVDGACWQGPPSESHALEGVPAVPCPESRDENVRALEFLAAFTAAAEALASDQLP